MSYNFRHTGGYIVNIYQLRKLAQREEIDYQFLLSALKKYTSPRDKISTWLKSGDLIRIKKGLYVFGQNVAEKPYSKELLANLIYGPSAISLTYALSYYGLIPEKVETITSITHNRIKLFETPIGEFKYYYINQKKYSIGIQLETIDQTCSFLIATPEKALCDQLHIIDKKEEIKTASDMEVYLFHNLRIDEALLLTLNKKILDEINQHYDDPRLSFIKPFLRKKN